MDLIVLISVFVALLVVLVTLFYFKSKDSKDGKWSRLRNSRKHDNINSLILESPKPAQQQGAGQGAGPQLVRNQRRNRVRAAEPQAAHAPAQQQHPDSDDDTAGLEVDEKMGAKKRAKLEAKAEKKVQRESELKAREEQKKRDGMTRTHWCTGQTCLKFFSVFRL